MAYTGFDTPNDTGTALGTLESKFWSQDLQILAEHGRGNGVVSGLAVTPSTLLTVDIAAGLIQREGTTKAVTATTKTVDTAHATLYRIDMISVNDAGTVVYTAGTAASAPAPPTIPQVSNINNIVLCYIYVEPLLTTIAAGNIRDKRAFVRGDVRIRKASDQVKAIDTTLANDSALFFDADANSTWWIEVHLEIVWEAAGPDAKYTFVGPSGATGKFGVHSASGTRDSYTMVPPTITPDGEPSTDFGTAITEEDVVAGNIYFRLFRARVRVGSTPGTVAFQWAQNASDANDLTVKAESMLTARKIA